MSRSPAFRIVGQGGFTYLAVMFMVFLLLLAASAAALVWRIEAQREAETELLFRGQQFATAIEHYRDRRKGLAQPYPTKLEQLLRDVNAGVVQRDLRQLYLDPITNSSDWGIVRAKGGGIIGVFSRSSRVPLKRAGFPEHLEGFAAIPQISSWIFYAAGASQRGAEPIEDSSAGATPTSNAPLSTLFAPVPSASPAGAPDPSETATALPPIRQPAVGKNNNSCATAIAADAAICAQQFARFGSQAGEDCSDSQAARAEACAVGDPLPILYFRSK
jgi:type II secretory pathway pseudopilin PulG